MEVNSHVAHPAVQVAHHQSEVPTLAYPHLRDHLDRPLYPVRSRNGTFTLAPRGKDMHHAAHAIHVEDEDTAFQMVASGTYKIRAVREQGQAPSLLGLGDRAVKSAERI